MAPNSAYIKKLLQHNDEPKDQQVEEIQSLHQGTFVGFDVVNEIKYIPEAVERRPKRAYRKVFPSGVTSLLPEGYL